MNILLTSVGRRSYIVEYFKEALEGIGSVYTSNSEYSIGMKYGDKHLITPLIYDENYIPTLMEFCKENDVKVLISLFDVDLLILAQNRHLFQEIGVKVILADEKFVRICNDKWETYKFVTNIGLKSPMTYKNEESLLKDIRANKIDFPIIIKPRWGMASLGIYIADNEKELEVLSEKSRKEVFNSHLKYESNLTKDEVLIYQEVLKGAEYGLDVINDLDHNYIDTFVKQKIVMRSGETDLGKTVKDDCWNEIGETIAKYSGHEGILSVDCFKTEKGIFVIEMNCRISGHYPLSHLAGVNYPQLVVDWMMGRETNPALLTFKEGLSIVKELRPVVLE